MANFMVPPGMGVPGVIDSPVSKYPSSAIPQLVESAQNELERRKNELEYRIGLLKQGPLTPEEQVELPTLEQQKQIVDRAIIQKQAAPAPQASPASGPAGNVAMPKAVVSGTGAPLPKTPEGYVPPPRPAEERASGTGSVTIDGKIFELGAGGNWDHAGIRQAMAAAEGQAGPTLDGFVDRGDSGIRNADLSAGPNANLIGGGVSTFSNPESDAERLAQQTAIAQLAAALYGTQMVPHPAGEQYGMVPLDEAGQIGTQMRLREIQSQGSNRPAQMQAQAMQIGQMNAFLKRASEDLARMPDSPEKAAKLRELQDASEMWGLAEKALLGQLRNQGGFE